MDDSNPQQLNSEQLLAVKKRSGAKKYFFIILVVILLATAGLTARYFYSKDVPDIIEPTSMAIVNIQGNQFTPEAVELQLGGTVSYMNTGSEAVSIVVKTNNAVQESEKHDKTLDEVASEAIAIEPGGQLDISYQETGEFGYSFSDNTEVFGTVIVR